MPETCTNTLTTYTVTPGSDGVLLYQYSLNEAEINIPFAAAVLSNDPLCLEANLEYTYTISPVAGNFMFT